MELGELNKALDYYKLSQKLFEQVNDPGFVYNEMSNIGNIYVMMHKTDSAGLYLEKVFSLSLDRYGLTYAEETGLEILKNKKETFRLRLIITGLE